LADWLALALKVEGGPVVEMLDVKGEGGHQVGGVIGPAVVEGGKERGRFASWRGVVDNDFRGLFGVAKLKEVRGVLGGLGAGVVVPRVDPGEG